MNADAYFPWALIGPVILIFLANIGFLIMAAVIMWRQQKKRNNKQKCSGVCGWLKAVITLIVVMGITWIIGLAVMETEGLLPLIYIFTIVVAFQGVFIYLALVLLTKSVRDELVKFTIKKCENVTKPSATMVRIICSLRFIHCIVSYRTRVL